MSPNYSLSQISFDLQRNLIKHFDLEVLRDNAKDKVIELSNHSTIRMGSINQVDWSWVGLMTSSYSTRPLSLTGGMLSMLRSGSTLDKETQKQSLYLLQGVEIITLQSFTTEDLVMSFQNGVQKQPGTRILV